MKIIGYYKNLALLRLEESYLVVNKDERKILFKGSEEEACKMFIMFAASFIDEFGRVV